MKVGLTYNPVQVEEAAILPRNIEKNLSECP
jgi:hypothetical protein